MKIKLKISPKKESVKTGLRARTMVRAGPCVPHCVEPPEGGACVWKCLH
jgi:hypothetical protein